MSFKPGDFIVNKSKTYVYNVYLIKADNGNFNYTCDSFEQNPRGDEFYISKDKAEILDDQFEVMSRMQKELFYSLIMQFIFEWQEPTHFNF
jgi:hypothetical protein